MFRLIIKFVACFFADLEEWALKPRPRGIVWPWERPKRPWFRELNSVVWVALVANEDGSPRDIPRLIRRMGSPRPRLQRNAFELLDDWIYSPFEPPEATSYCIPFLLKYVEEPDHPERARILGRLGEYAVGLIGHHVPVGFGPRIRLLRETLQQRVDDHRANGVRSLTRDEESMAHVIATSDALRRGLPTLRAVLLEDSDTLRRASASALACLPESIEEFGDDLITAAGAPGSSGPTRACCILALSLACDPQSFGRYHDRVGPWLHDASEPVRIASAFAIGTHLRTQSGDEVNVVLLRALGNHELEDDWIWSWTEDVTVAEWAAAVLRLTMAHDPKPFVDRAIEVMPSQRPTINAQIGWAVLDLLFDDATSSISDALLWPLQRRMLSAITTLRMTMDDDVWYSALAQHGLPEAPEDLAEWLAEMP